MIVGWKHKIVLSTSEVNADRDNCPVNTVVDTTWRGVSPVELDYYPSDPAGLFGMNKATYYNVLIDENKFTYVLASCPRSAGTNSDEYLCHLHGTTVPTLFNLSPLHFATSMPAHPPFPSQLPFTVRTLLLPMIWHTYM